MLSLSLILGFAMHLCVLLSTHNSGLAVGHGISALYDLTQVSLLFVCSPLRLACMRLSLTSCGATVAVEMQTKSHCSSNGLIKLPRHQ